jgi:predicted nucleic acid-binding protein
LKNYIVDTNALISFLTDRNPSQQDNIAELLDRASRLKVRVLCPQNVLTEFVYVMDTVYGLDKTEIRDLARDLVELPGVDIVHEINLKTLFQFWPDSVPDYGDAIIAALCKDTRGSSVVTFDQKFKVKLKQLDLTVASFK